MKTKEKVIENIKQVIDWYYEGEEIEYRFKDCDWLTFNISNGFSVRGGEMNYEYRVKPKTTEFICCGVLEKMNLGWMVLEDGTKCMPYIKGHSDKEAYRVNNCPSCGRYVRNVIIKKIHVK